MVVRSVGSDVVDADRKTLYIISRHKATIDYLIDKLGKDRDVVILEHLNSSDDIPAGVDVAGNLPVGLIAELVRKGCCFYYVSLKVPPELRGKELSREEVEKHISLLKINKLEVEEV